MRNWAGNYEYRATGVVEPRSIEELQEVVRATPRIRALGSRHSFNAIADTDGIHVSVAKLRRRFDLDTAGRTLTVDGGVRYGDVCPPLHQAGYALHNLGSLPHISVAGAVATGTHGSGDRSRNLAGAVAGVEIVRADGELETISRTDASADFAGAVVALGALGVVASVTLNVEPTYEMRQDVYDFLPFAAFEHFDEITRLADAVSFFTDWRSRAFHQLWLKRRLPADAPPAEIFGAKPAPEARHPIPGLSPDACTQQLGVPGPWSERLPHFRLDHTPSSGDELQSEFFIDRKDAVAAFGALQPLSAQLGRLVQVTEIRTIAADELWLSPEYGRESVAFHFTWEPDWPSVREMLPSIEHALSAFGVRAHWAKLFTLAPEVVRAAYPRLQDFQLLASRFDPDRKFANSFLESFVLSQP